MALTWRCFSPRVPGPPAGENCWQQPGPGQGVDEEGARLVSAVEYAVPDRGGDDNELIYVITTVLDPAELSAAEVAFAYHQRWEHESRLAEIKTHLRGGGAVLRSQSPDLVEQEMWGCCWPITRSGG